MAVSATRKSKPRTKKNRSRQSASSSSASAHHAVIDIGSNSIRLVVFEGLGRSPVPVFNEKVLSALGRRLQSTGRLDPAGVESALVNLDRFVALARAMNVTRLDLLATAAVREAEDGAEFVAAVKKRTGCAIRVLDGGDEARLSAMGVLSGMPAANGIMGDLGGGSLELVELEGGTTQRSATLPLGPFRLARANGKRNDPDAIIDQHLSAVNWLGAGKGRDFYPVGGAWRGLAQIHMAQRNYPLRVIDYYTVPRGEVEDLAALVARQSKASLARLPEVPQRRIETLPLAALVLRRVLQTIKPSRVVFSAHGLREGVHFAALPESVRRLDPLIAAGRSYVARHGRFDPALGETLTEWTAPLFDGIGPEDERLRHAACLLSDLGWTEHPDYRVRHAFYRVMRLNVMGVDHPGRAFLAIAVLARYNGSVHDEAREEARAVGLDDDRLDRAAVLGLGLRLAYTLSGGAEAVLKDTRLRHGAKKLTLVVAKRRAAVLGDVVERRLQQLAAACDRTPAIEIAA
ncbi:MAG TPA: Ppx/GppA family phosphatase [Alphaproteobacteria bacterium]|jgi:exopolyphosphatase/guanosine-5'-triphosphate,3'-diphosphate pyrophosphatase